MTGIYAPDGSLNTTISDGTSMGSYASDGSLLITIAGGLPAPEAHTHEISDVTGLQAALDGKQSTLVSGTSLKTINSTSLLGSGDIAISGGSASWTTIYNATPTASSQIVIDITGYSILRWKMTGCRHDNGTAQSIGPYASTNAGSTYSTAIASLATAANSVDIYGSGFLLAYGSFLKGIGNSGSTNSGGNTNPTGVFNSAPHTSIAFKPSAGSFQAVGNITVEGLA